jgi:uncharacterized protein YbaP (TraB family)
VQAQPPKATKSLLWRITGNGIKTPSYIFGTFHLCCSNDVKFPDILKAIIHQSKQIFFEIKMDDPEMTQKIMSGIAMKDGHQLKEFYSGADFDSISNIFRNKTNIPISFFASYKPYLLIPLIYPSMLGCNPIGMEKELQKISDMDFTPVKGLETIEFQMQLFDSIPYATQAKMLKSNLFEYDKYKKELLQMMKIYQQKDIDKMQKSIETDMEINKYEDMLLLKRNKTWIPVISSEIKQLPTFIAVGAGHLGGSEGLLSLLRKQGFIVTPVLYK